MLFARDPIDDPIIAQIELRGCEDAMQRAVKGQGDGLGVPDDVIVAVDAIKQDAAA